MYMIFPILPTAHLHTLHAVCQSESWGMTLRWWLLQGRAIIVLNLVTWNYHRQHLFQLMCSCWPHCGEIVWCPAIPSLQLVFHGFNHETWLLIFHYWMKGRWNKRILNRKTSPKAKNCILLVYSFTKCTDPAAPGSVSLMTHPTLFHCLPSPAAWGRLQRPAGRILLLVIQEGKEELPSGQTLGILSHSSAPRLGHCQIRHFTEHLLLLPFYHIWGWLTPAACEKNNVRSISQSAGINTSVYKHHGCGLIKAWREVPKAFRRMQRTGNAL